MFKGHSAIFTRSFNHLLFEQFVSTTARANDWVSTNTRYTYGLNAWYNLKKPRIKT